MKWVLEHDLVSLKKEDLRECLEESAQQIQILSPQKELSLTLPTDPIYFQFDRGLLKRAIVNLLENAMEVASSTVGLTLFTKDNATLIHIFDDGPGMSESNVSLHLQGRGRSSKANRQAFGLSSANHIVRAHGGKLLYKQNPSGGSCFEIQLGEA